MAVFYEAIEIKVPNSIDGTWCIKDQDQTISLAISQMTFSDILIEIWDITVVQEIG